MKAPENPYTEQQIDKAYDNAEFFAELFKEAFDSDDEPFEKVGRAMLNAYFNASDDCKSAVNNMLTAICGYSMNTLISKVIKGED